MIVIKVMERDMIVTTTSRITSGSVNLPVKFDFKGDEWDDLVKTAVFIGSGEERDVALITDECAVPADVLTEAGGDLKIGVYGRLANGATVIPTIWGRVQYIYEGTEMGEPSPHSPEPDWTAQVQQAAATALTKAQAVEAAAAAGDFNGVSPEVTIDTIAHGHSVTITDEEHPEGQSFPVLDGASAYEQAVAGGYTGTEAQFNQELKSFKTLSEQAAGSATQAAGSASAAAGSASAAAGSETAAAGSASAAAGAASAAAGSASAAEQSAIDAAAAAEATGGSETAAAASATAAAASATAAADSATAAEEHEYDAEAWADGERKGSPVGSTDKTYHNNAKYYAQQAGASATAAGQSVDAAAASATAAADSATAAASAKTAAEAAQTAAVAAKTATETARDTAVSTLQTEGAAQRTAIQQKGAEVLESIPEDYTDLSDDVDDLKSAITFIQTKTGEEIDESNIPLTDGYGIYYTTGKRSSSSVAASSGYIEIPNGFNFIRLSMLVRTSDVNTGLAFYTAASESSFIPGSGVKNRIDTSLSQFGSEIRTIPIPSTAKYFRTTWASTTYAGYSNLPAFSCFLVKQGTIDEAEETANYAKEAVDKCNGSIYLELMGKKTIASAYRVFYVNKNHVDIRSSGSNTSYRCCTLLGTPTVIEDSMANADLSSVEFFPINFDPDAYNLILTVQWKSLYASSKNYIHVATKNESSETITHTFLTADDSAYPKIRRLKLTTSAPDIRTNGNFALIVENRNASVENSFNYWLSIEPANTEFGYSNDTITDTVNKYASLLSSKHDIESFMFFTDSHILGGGGKIWRSKLESILTTMGTVYNTAPVDFCIFGGDAITGNSSYYSTITPAQCVSYLSYNDKMSRTIFGNDTYLPMVGNHDMNYLGTAEISTQDIVNASFRKWGRAYYKYKANTSTIFVLDTGKNHIDGDYDVPMDVYKWKQIDFLGKALAEDDPEHSIIAMHIIRNNKAPQPNFQMFIQANELCGAYNAHGTITLNNVEYDFSNCTGRVEFFLGGHLHSDAYDIFENGIPCIMRANLSNGDVVPTYDLVLCDWYVRTVTFYRIGNGDSITVDLDTGEEITYED